MFDDLVSFVVRRAVCGLTPKNYNNLFMATIRHLAKHGVAPDRLREHLSASSSDIARWPTDTEFVNACRTARLYDGRDPARLDAPRIRQLLTELEAELRRHVRSEEPTPPNLSRLDIDHIMPCSWYAHWPMEDGTTVRKTEAERASTAALLGMELTPAQTDILRREDAIRTLGNLTLLNLSVNREAQNKNFKTKQDLLLHNTNLSLNVKLLKISEWVLKEIEERSKRLANTALRVYPRPQENA